MGGTIAFASSAVLSVAEQKVDIFAAVVLGLITAVGGGTLRDVILNVPVFWADETIYLWVAMTASVATFYATSLFGRREIRRLFLYIDGAAVAMFAIQATEKVWRLDFGLPLGPIILGIVTATGGGMTRDVLSGRPTLLFSRDLYAIPITVGCILLTLILHFAPEYRGPGSIVCVGVIFAIRAAAIYWDIKVPDWSITGFKRGAS
jgi:uncharacterized membrane protein YeiH